MFNPSRDQARQFLIDAWTKRVPYPVLNFKRRPASIFDYEVEDFEVLDYQHHPAIKAPVAV